MSGVSETGGESDDQGTRGDEERIVSRNPATLEVNDVVREVSPEGVQEAVRDARRAQEVWGGRTPEQRLLVLNDFRKLLIERKDEVAETVSRETGKPSGEAIAAEIAPVLDALKYVDERGREVIEEDIPLGNALFMDRRSKVVREPVGVVGIITPWNYPFSIPGSQVVSALYAGNSVVLKPAEQTPLSAELIREMLLEAGLPENALKLVHGRGGVTGQALVESGVDHISFTGSTDVGLEIQESCSSRRMPTCLELGGSDPAIVLDDADLDLTADGIVWARFTNAGQTCTAVKRVYADESIEPELTRKIIDRVEDLRVGYGDVEYEVGPLISEDAVERIHSQVERSREMGAEVLLGGERFDDLPGHFYKPTVLTNVKHDMPVVREETFGPVLPIISVEDQKSAVEMANDTEYGLTASVWTIDVERGEEVAEKIDAGTVTINDHAYTYALNATPWGGYKNSGEGRSHGRWGLEEVTQPKHLHTAQGTTPPRGVRLRDPWWFPYREDLGGMMGDTLNVIYGTSTVSRLRKAPRMVSKLVRNRDKLL